MKKLILLIIFGLMLSVSNGQKQYCMWYLPKITTEQAQKLAGFQLLIVDPECVFTSRSQLDMIRTLNPDIKILAYYNISEWFVPMFKDKPWSMNMVNFMQNKENWWLHGVNGKRISFWKGMNTMNCCMNCQRYDVGGGKKQNYIQFATERFKEDILSEFPFDGVLRDNFWPAPYWLGRINSNKGVDANRDRRPDNAAAFNRQWYLGMEYFSKEIRKFGGPNFILINNPANDDFRDGWPQLENFPDIYVNEVDTVYEAWFDNLNLAAQKNVSFFNARKENSFFTVCSSLLINNAYVSFTQNTFPKPEFDLKLGKPLEEARSDQNGECCRTYEHGIVCVNPLTKTAQVNYNDGRIRTN